MCRAVGSGQRCSDWGISPAALEFYFEIAKFILSRQYDWISELMDASPERIMRVCKFWGALRASTPLRLSRPSDRDALSAKQKVDGNRSTQRLWQVWKSFALICRQATSSLTRRRSSTTSRRVGKVNKKLPPNFYSINHLALIKSNWCSA